MSLNILFCSDVTIKERTSVHGNIDPKLIYPDIKAAQDMYIEPIIGTALFKKLQALIDAGNVTEPYATLLNVYITEALIYYTLADLPITTSYQFWNKGVVRRSGNDTELPSYSELTDLANKYRDRAEFYAERMRRYLKQNYTLFPEYMNPGTGYDDMHPKNNVYKSPVYLGDDCDCMFNYDFPKHEK